jgi:hypothetical protein
MKKSARTFILILNFALLSILTACGGGGSNSLPPTPTKSEFNVLTLIFDGSGSGSVTLTPTNTVCTTNCTEKFTTDTKVTLSTIAQTGSTFNGFKGDSDCIDKVVTMSTAVNCTATFLKIPGMTVYELKIAVKGNGSGSIESVPLDPQGINCGLNCSKFYAKDDVVTLQAKPTLDNIFTGWSTGCGTSSGTTALETAITMTAAQLCTANFKLKPNTVLNRLSITLAGTGKANGQVFSVPNGISCDNSATNCSKDFVENLSVELTAKVTNVNTVFKNWSGSCGSGTNPVVNITMSATTSCTATFDIITFKLSVKTDGGAGTGTVTSSPTGIDCGVKCNKFFNTTTPITLTATPADNKTIFFGWVEPGCTSKSFKLTKNLLCTAIFNIVTTKTFDLNITLVGNGSVSADSRGKSCIGIFTCYRYDAGATAQLTANADLNYSFTGWDGIGCIASTNNKATVLMDKDRSCQATFTRTYSLNATVATNSSGTGSIIFPFNAEIASCGLTCNIYLAGEIITLTAKAGTNSIFTGWTGAGCVSSIGNTAKVFIHNSPRICQATFTKTNNLTIKVDPTSLGTGTVNFTSGTPAASCGTLCKSYGTGDIVTITAQETGSRSIFAGWSGSGCVATDNIATVITNSATTCTALFNKLPALTHKVTLGSNYLLTRSGTIGESISWVIEKDGEVVLTRGASTELSYTYSSNTAGSSFRIWLEDAIIGIGYVRISNILYYSIKPSTYNLFATIIGAGTVSSDSTNSCGFNCWRYTAGKSATLTATPDSNSTFSRWDGNGCTATGLTTATVTMNTSTTCIAVFNDNTTPTHTITLNSADYQIYRNGSLGENLLWVVEKDGIIVQESNAANELSFIYSTNTAGSRFRVWLNKFNGTSYVRSSNVILYSVPSSFNLSSEIIGIGTVSSDSTVSCGANCWSYLAKTNAILTANTDASSTFSGWTGTGCTVTGPSDTTATVMMNETTNCTATFTSAAILSHSLTLGANNKLYRSGNLGVKSLTWVIEKNGTIVLQRAAENELSYTHFSNTSGSHFRIWLKWHNGIEYVVVSNTLLYSIP